MSSDDSGLELWVSNNQKLSSLCSKFKILATIETQKHKHTNVEIDQEDVTPKAKKQKRNMFCDSDDEGTEDTMPQMEKDEYESFMDIRIPVGEYDDFNLLVWWKRNEEKFPILAKVA
jgi:hypothetical protein